MKKLSLGSLGLLTLGALLQTTTLNAQYNFITRDAGWYWRVDTGASIPLDGHITEFGPWSTGQKISYDVGFELNGAFGYFFNKYLATELELGWSWNSVDSVENVSSYETSFGTAPILANVVLQYPIPQTRIVPYIGGGVGGAATFFDTDGFYRTVPGGSISLHGSDSDFEFAWQGMAGVRIALNDKMSVGLGYRFLHVDASTFSFDSWYHGQPSMNLGFSAHESHIVTLNFLMKL